MLAQVKEEANRRKEKRKKQQQRRKMREHQMSVASLLSGGLLLRTKIICPNLLLQNRVSAHRVHLDQGGQDDLRQQAQQSLQRHVDRVALCPSAEARVRPEKIGERSISQRFPKLERYHVEYATCVGGAQGAFRFAVRTFFVRKVSPSYFPSHGFVRKKRGGELSPLSWICSLDRVFQSLTPILIDYFFHCFHFIIIIMPSCQGLDVNKIGQSQCGALGQPRGRAQEHQVVWLLEEGSLKILKVDWTSTSGLFTQ